MSQTSNNQTRNLEFADRISITSYLGKLESGVRLLGWPLRVATIFIVFVVQGLWLTVRFDTASVAASSQNWTSFFQFIPMLPRIGITLIVLIPIMGRNRMWDHVRAFTLALHDYRDWLIWWLGQFTSFAILTIASMFIFVDETAILPTSAAWPVAWIMSAVSCCVCCLFALAPPSFWWRFSVTERWVLLAGLVVSLCATKSGRLFQSLWNPLGDSTFRLVEWWLSFVYTKAIVSDAGSHLLGTETFTVEIAPQCSGYEGMGLISVFILVMLVLFRQRLRFPHAWLLLLIGVVTIWICNSLRIAALIVIGTEYSASVALGGFHSQAGWILFNLVSLGLMAGALQFKFFVRTGTTTVREISPVVAYLLPFLVFTAVGMIIAATVDDSSTLYPVSVLMSLSVLWISRDVLKQLDWTCSPQAIVCGIGVYLAWIGLAWLDPQAREVRPVAPPSCETISGLTWTIFRIIGAVVTVPIIEELAFRGFFLRRLVRFDFGHVEFRTTPVWAIFVSSLAFGLLHHFWVGGVIAGISYCWLTRQRGNLADAIQAHAVTNGLIAVTVLCTGTAWLW